MLNISAHGMKFKKRKILPLDNVLRSSLTRNQISTFCPGNFVGLEKKFSAGIAYVPLELRERGLKMENSLTENIISFLSLLLVIIDGVGTLHGHLIFLDLNFEWQWESLRNFWSSKDIVKLIACMDSLFRKLPNEASLDFQHWQMSLKTLNNRKFQNNWNFPYFPGSDFDQYNKVL